MGDDMLDIDKVPTLGNSLQRSERLTFHYIPTEIHSNVFEFCIKFQSSFIVKLEVIFFKLKEKLFHFSCGIESAKKKSPSDSGVQKFIAQYFVEIRLRRMRIKLSVRSSKLDKSLHLTFNGQFRKWIKKFH